MIRISESRSTAGSASLELQTTDHGKLHFKLKATADLTGVTADDLDLGATVKYLRQQVGTYQASGMGVDLGLIYHLGKARQDFAQLGYKNLAVGLAVSNALEPQTRLFQDVDQPVAVNVSQTVRVDVQLELR